MEPFDAIVENLEQVQRKSLEAIRNRLELVLESLDKLVGEAQTAVREAVPGEAEELIPLAEVREGLRRAEEVAQASADEAERLRRRLEELEASAAAGKGPSLELLRELDAARSQKDLLHGLLPVLKQYTGRAVVLVLREGRASAWSGIGLADAERLRLWQGDAAASPALSRLAEGGVACRFHPFADPVFSTWLAGEPPAEEALLVPVALRGRIVGAIYLDHVAGEPWEPETAQTLVALACWLIDTLPHRPKAPSPPLTEPVQVGAEAPAQPAAEEAPAEVPEPERSAAPEEAVAEAPQEAPPVSEPQPSQELEPEAEPAAPAFDPSRTVRVEIDQTPVQPPPSPEAPPPQPAAPEIPPELQAAHDEAQRFARLLVSEIKLYNEEEVEQGRQNGDIYERLKEDIDRSREMYEQRVPEEVRRVRDYFHEELVRVLAGGDPDLLGV